MVTAASGSLLKSYDVNITTKVFCIGVIILLEMICSSIALTVSLQNCPLHNRLHSVLPTSDGFSTFNYTQDVISNPDLYWCESMPNMFYKEYNRVQGLVASFNKYTSILEIDNGLFCNYTNGDSVFHEKAMKSFKLFANETLVRKYLTTYLEGLLVEKNYTNPMRYYYYGFDVEIQMDDFKTTWDMWINYFNYFLFCKEGNPYFYEFRQISLPFIAQFSKYEKVKTLDVLFGTNVVQFCGSTQLTFYNRTLYCLCTDDTIISNDSITFRSMMSDKCGGAMELFWVPAANHLSLKIIEILIFFIQATILPILCLLPIMFRNGIKWKDHIKSRGTLNTIEKGMKTPRQQELAAKDTTSTASNGQTANQNQVKIDVGAIDNTQSQVCTSNRSNKKEPNRSSMKEQLSHELIRVICDLKLLAGISLEFSILCLLGSSLQHAAEPKGGAAYPTPTLIVASVAFLCVANIPLAALFVEVLLKLSGNNKKVSIHGLITFSAVTIILIIFILACIIAAFFNRVTGGIVRVLVVGFSLLFFVISWIILLSYSLKIYYMLKKKRNVFFLQFKFSQYLLVISLALIYLIYEAITEIAFVTYAVDWESIWTICWKHRIGSYVIGVVIWMATYVLFSLDHFKDFYKKLGRAFGITKK